MIQQEINKLSSGKKGNTMNKIKWDDNYFNQAGIYFWIYNCGRVESTNYRTNRTGSLKMQINYHQKILSSNKLIKINKNKNK